MIKKYFVGIILLSMSCGKKDTMILPSSFSSSSNISHLESLPLIVKDQYTINTSLYLIKTMKICSAKSKEPSSSVSVRSISEWANERIKKNNKSFEMLKMIEVNDIYSNKMKLMINSLSNFNEQLTEANIDKLELSINKVESYQDLMEKVSEDKVECISEMIKEGGNKSIFYNLRRISKQEKYFKRKIEEKNIFTSISKKQLELSYLLAESIKKIESISPSLTEEEGEYYYEISRLQELKRKIISLNIREEYGLYTKYIDSNLLKREESISFLLREDKSEVEMLDALLFNNVQEVTEMFYPMQSILAHEIATTSHQLDERERYFLFDEKETI